MIFAELLALLALTGGSALAIIGFARRSTASRQLERQMQEELRDALRSKDHQRLEDWLVLYAEHVPASTKELIERRRDDLYIAANER
jgi:hypothetical protein